MTMKIITGYTGTKHITPADDAGLHKSIFGEGDYVLPAGSQLAATIQSATEVRIADGELVMQGRHARNDSGYQAVAIANGTQGMYRNDLIVARYTIDSKSVESISLVVITGTATSGTASDPAHNTGNIENGETRDFPLYRVKLNGITIDSVEKLWESPVLPVERGGTGKTTVDGIKSLLGLAKAAFVNLVTVALGGTGKSSHTSNAVLTGNGTNPVNNVPTANGAFYATTANGAGKFGTLPIAQGGTGGTSASTARSNLGLGSVATENTLPVSKGGTGSTTQAGARTNLGLDDKVFIKHPLNTINIDNTAGNWTTDISLDGHGTVPMTFINVTQTTGVHFAVQVAIKCDSSGVSSGRTQRMWIRDKHIGGTGTVWSNWREVLVDGNGFLWTKMWENTDPTSAMTSFGSTTLGAEKYNMFLLVFRASTEYDREISAIVRRGKEGEVHSIFNLYASSATVQFCGRKFIVGAGNDNNVVEIGDCSVKGASQNSPSTDNAKLIPVAIYGCVAR